MHRFLQVLVELVSCAEKLFLNISSSSFDLYVERSKSLVFTVIADHLNSRTLHAASDGALILFLILISSLCIVCITNVSRSDSATQTSSAEGADFMMIALVIDAAPRVLSRVR